jgi:hypothetical protein
MPNEQAGEAVLHFMMGRKEWTHFVKSAEMCRTPNCRVFGLDRSRARLHIQKVFQNDSRVGRTPERVDDNKETAGAAAPRLHVGLLMGVSRQEQHRPVAHCEESEGANPETCRGNEKRHTPIRTEGGRDARDCRERDKDIDHTSKPIRRQVTPGVAARDSRHHPQNHRADRSGSQSMDGGALRQIGVEH